MSSFCLGSNPQSGEAVLQCLGGEHPNACLWVFVSVRECCSADS